VCIGKALGGGMPISACIGRGDVMASWAGRGEPIHTATFFGHPIACAAAMAALDVMEDERVAERAMASGARWTARLAEVAARQPRAREVRGRGMVLGMVLESRATTLRVVPALLARGWITLPAGRDAEVLQLLPPIAIADELLDAFAEDLDAVLGEAS
jgi:4-aminobutyrate aminotransferase/(S)-3-amino-2-methylpropionate transaminase